MDKLVLAIIVLLIAALFIGGVGGYVLNIVKLFQCDFKAPFKAEIVRGVSIPLGIGCIVGWLDIDDGPESESQ